MLISKSRASAARATLRGELVTSDGEVIGEHAGIHNFTVGQRKGLGVATGSPLYVIQIRMTPVRLWWGGMKNSIPARCGPGGST